MKIKDVMTPDVDTLDPDASLQEAAEMMSASGLSTLPITERGRVVGLLSESDIVSRVVAAGLDPRETKVDEVMSEDFLMCREDCGLERAERLMTEAGETRILVLDDEGVLAGIATMSDIASELSDGYELELPDARALAYN